MKKKKTQLETHMKPTPSVSSLITCQFAMVELGNKILLKVLMHYSPWWSLLKFNKC